MLRADVIGAITVCTLQISRPAVSLRLRAMMALVTLIIQPESLLPVRLLNTLYRNKGVGSILRDAIAPISSID